MRIFLFVLLGVGIFLIPNCSATQIPSVSQKINTILDDFKWDGDNRWGWDNKSWDGNEGAVLNNPEVKFLIENKDISLPLIFKRLEDDPPSKYHHFINISDDTWPYMKYLGMCFLIFKETKEVNAVPYICNYLDIIDKQFNEMKDMLHDTPEQKEETMRWLKKRLRGVPYPLAISALVSITDGAVKIKEDQAPKEISEQAKQWYAEHKKNPEKK